MSNGDLSQMSMLELFQMEAESQASGADRRPADAGKQCNGG